METVSETADESKNKSRQIACERVKTLKNAASAVKRLDGWNASMTGEERAAPKFSKEAK